MSVADTALTVVVNSMKKIRSEEKSGLRFENCSGYHLSISSGHLIQIWPSGRTSGKR